LTFCVRYDAWKFLGGDIQEDDKYYQDREVPWQCSQKSQFKTWNRTISQLC